MLSMRDSRVDLIWEPSGWALCWCCCCCCCCYCCWGCWWGDSLSLTTTNRLMTETETDLSNRDRIWKVKESSKDDGCETREVSALRSAQLNPGSLGLEPTLPTTRPPPPWAWVLFRLGPVQPSNGQFKNDQLRLQLLAGGSTFPYIACCVLIRKNKFSTSQNNLAFIWDMCCHLTMCLHLMEPHWG